MHAGIQAKPKPCATLFAVVARLKPQRRVELRLLNSRGWNPVGEVAIPADQPLPRIGDILQVRYRYADRQSKALYQPTYLGQRRDRELHECVMSQLKYKYPPQETPCR